MTKAALTGKLRSTKVRIPFSELSDSIGVQSNKDIDLVVSINLEWDEHQTGIKDIVAESLKDEFEAESEE
jgi:hypothetical protein